MRIDPPPSDPVAKGTIPEAMAAALPPEDPPGEWSRFHGLRVGPNTRVVGVGLPSELRGVGLAHHHTPGRHQACHQRRVGCRRRVVGEHRRAMGGHVAGRVLQILHSQRDAGQWPGVDAGRHLLVDVVGRGPGSLLVNGHEGVECRIVEGDLAQCMLGQLDGRTARPSRTDLASVDHRFAPKVHDLDRTGGRL